MMKFLKLRPGFTMQDISMEVKDMKKKGHRLPKTS